MVKKLLALAIALWPTLTWAQDIPNHSMPIGRGAGVVGWGVAGPCATGQSLVWLSGPTVDPSCASPTTLPLTSAHIYVGSAGNLATDVPLSGDCSMANTGAITCTKSGGVNLGALAFLNVGTRLISSGGNLNLDVSGVTAATYGSATQSAQCAFNAQGQATGCSNILITPAFSSLTGTPTTLAGYGITSPLPLAQGGSAQATAVAARQSSGFNVFGDQGTGHGDADATIGNTERMAYATTNFTSARTWTLPAANVTTQPYLIRISDFGHVNGANTLTVQRAGGDTINGGTAVTITAANGGFDCYSNGTSAWACNPQGSVSSGGVTSVTAGTGLTGGTITTTGTVAIDYTRNNTWTGDVRAASGDPWCDVKAKGAVGDNTNDDSTAFQACVTQLSIGGTVYVPPGQYYIGPAAGTTVFSGSNGYIFAGSGEGSIITTKTDDRIALSWQATRGQIRDLVFICKGIGATQPCVKTGTASTINGEETRIYNIQVTGGAINLQNFIPEMEIWQSKFLNPYSGPSIYTAGGIYMERVQIDQPWPIAVPTFPYTINAWAQSTHYNVGDVVSNQGVLLQARTSGTSLNSGTGPTLQNYGVDITDGTGGGAFAWRLACPVNNTAIQIDGGIPFYGFDVDMTGCYYYNVQVTAAASKQIFFTRSIFAQAYLGGFVSQVASADISLTDNMFQQCLNATCFDVFFNAPFVGGVNFSGNLMYGGAVGFEASGGTGYNIMNNRCEGKQNQCIFIIGATTQVNIIGNLVGGNSSNHGLNTTAIQTGGTADYLNIMFNICHGATNSYIAGASGTHKNDSAACL